MANTSLRNQVIQIAARKYHTKPERLWAKYPGYEVLRHTENRKWYAVIMDVPKNRLGLEGEEKIDIMDIKIDSEVVGSLLLGKGIFPGYHMNKGNWISVLLDGTVAVSTVELLLDVSFGLTDKKKK